MTKRIGQGRVDSTRRSMVMQGFLASAGAVLASAPAARAFDLPRPAKLRDADNGIETSGRGSLRAHAEARGLLIGCAVNMSLLEQQPSYGRVIAEQFNVVVGENCMKWAALRPTSATFDFKQADALVAFAEEHKLKVRGHNLCWHENLPEWFAATATKENARQLLTDHIHTVAGRYKGRIHSWDVVNEAIWIKDGRSDGMRVSPWLELIGPEYVEIAFRAARDADPTAILTYNDYGLEYDTPDELAKRAAVLSLIERLQAAGAPLQAVGIQSHLRTGDIASLGDGVHDFIKKLHKRRLDSFITEMDVNDDGLSEEDVTQQDRDVATVYKHYLQEVLKEQSVKAVLTWGLADQQSWLQAEKERPKRPDRAQRPLLLGVSDGVYSPKPAFYATRSALDEAKRR